MVILDEMLNSIPYNKKVHILFAIYACLHTLDYIRFYDKSTYSEMRQQKLYSHKLDARIFAGSRTVHTIYL